MASGRVARRFCALVKVSVRDAVPRPLVRTRADRTRLPYERQLPRLMVTTYGADPRKFLNEIASRSGDPTRSVATPYEPIRAVQLVVAAALGASINARRTAADRTPDSRLFITRLRWAPV
jgi:hypothetical protein